MLRRIESSDYEPSDWGLELRTGPIASLSCIDVLQRKPQAANHAVGCDSGELNGTHGK